MSGSEKSDGAFRTIREVADWLGVPTHVLRFWESKFDQIAPVKGAGGRRYYRPADMQLLGGIKVMLHDQGLTIRGVGQKIDDEGVETVMALSPDLDTPGTQPASSKRVIRTGEDAAKVVPLDRSAPGTTPAEDPSDHAPSDDPSTEQPDAPNPDTQPAQPDDDLDQSVKDSDDPAPDDVTPQPDHHIDNDQAPGSAPEPPAEHERGVEINGPKGTKATPRKAFAPAAPAQPDIVLTALQQRQLRRIVRKLRDLIEDVEDEISQGNPPA